MDLGFNSELNLENYLDPHFDQISRRSLADT